MTLRWTTARVSGTPPSPRFSHEIALIECITAGTACAYMFGGIGGDEPQFYGDLMKLDLMSMTWSSIPLKGRVIPSSREGHSLTAVGTKLYLFGGSLNASDDTSDNCVFVFDTQHEEWSEPVVHGVVPSPRLNHSAVAIGSDIYVFGGYDDGEANNELYILHTKDMMWSRPQNIKGSAPAARCDHILTAHNNGFFVTGGSGGQNVLFNDIHFFDSCTMSWMPVVTTGEIYSKRNSHTVSIADGKLWLFGGVNDSEDDTFAQYNDVVVLDMVTKNWDRPVIEGCPPECRWGHVSVVFKNQMFIFGGTSEDVEYNDIWRLIGVGPTDELSNTSDSVVQHQHLEQQRIEALQSEGKNGNRMAPMPMKRNLPVTLPRTVNGSESKTDVLTYTEPPMINLTTSFSIPSLRPTVQSPVPAKVEQRSFYDLENNFTSQIRNIFVEITEQFKLIDKERAELHAERSAFEEEQMAAVASFEAQQIGLSNTVQVNKEALLKWVAERKSELIVEKAAIDNERATLNADIQSLERSREVFAKKKQEMEKLMASF